MASVNGGDGGEEDGEEAGEVKEGEADVLEDISENNRKFPQIK